MTENNNNNSSRTKRVPLFRQPPLSEYSRPGYVARWFNDVPGAIQAAELAGYTKVVGHLDNSNNRAQQESQMGSVIKRVVNWDPNAPCRYAVLMEIPEEYYNEAQAEKQLENDRIMASIDPEKFGQEGADYGEIKLDSIKGRKKF